MKDATGIKAGDTVYYVEADEMLCTGRADFSLEDVLFKYTVIQTNGSRMGRPSLAVRHSKTLTEPLTTATVYRTIKEALEADVQCWREQLANMQKAMPTLERLLAEMKPKNLPGATWMELREIACEELHKHAKAALLGFKGPGALPVILWKWLDKQLHEITGTWERQERGEVAPSAEAFRSDLLAALVKIEWPETMCKPGTKSKELYERWRAWKRGKCDADPVMASVGARPRFQGEENSVQQVRAV